MFEKSGMNQEEIREFLKESMKDAVDDSDYDGNVFKSVYLGTYMGLDPCGKYHHFLSPNGATERCEQFWDSMEKVSEELGGWIHDSEGDGCDVIFSFGLKDSFEIQEEVVWSQRFT